MRKRPLGVNSRNKAACLDGGQQEDEENEGEVSPASLCNQSSQQLEKPCRACFYRKPGVYF